MQLNFRNNILYRRPREPISNFPRNTVHQIYRDLHNSTQKFLQQRKIKLLTNHPCQGNQTLEFKGNRVNWMRSKVSEDTSDADCLFRNALLTRLAAPLATFFSLGNSVYQVLGSLRCR
jgi:hypothetical protein